MKFQRLEATPEKLFKYFKLSDFQTQFVELLTDAMELATQTQSAMPGKCCHEYLDLIAVESVRIIGTQYGRTHCEILRDEGTNLI